MPTQVAHKKKYYWDELALIRKIGEIVDTYNSIVFGDNKEDYIRFQAAYPDEIFDTSGETTTLVDGSYKLICYDISRKTDGSIGETEFSNKTRPRPIVVESKDILKSYEEDNETVDLRKVQETYLKVYDVMFRFDCLAPSDMQSMQLVLDFEKMLEINAKYLEQGCQRFIYKGRRPSYFNRDTKYKSRTCEFYAQVQQLWFLEEDRINQINIEYLSKTKIS